MIMTTAPRNRIREAREARGLSLNGLARLLDVTPQTIYSLERFSYGRRPLRVDPERLAEVLSVDITWLFPLRDGDAA